MDYLISVYGENDEPEMYAGPVEHDECRYLRLVQSKLKPLTDDEYLTGPAIILNTAARFSYVLDDEDVWWCIERDPGMIVVRFSPGGAMSWAVLRSPVPEFGGRDPDPIDVEDYDEDAPNPQYTLVFDPWDAQFCEQDREWGSFKPTDETVNEKWGRAMAHVSEISDQLSEKYPDFDAWRALCMKNLEEWSGEGLRHRELIDQGNRNAKSQDTKSQDTKSQDTKSQDTKSPPLNTIRRVRRRVRRRPKKD